jgi:integrase
MSVFKRNEQGNYYIQFNHRGKTYVKSARTENRKTAERMEREWKAEIHAIEELGELPRIKLKDVLAELQMQNTANDGGKYLAGNVRMLNQKFNTDLHMDQIQDWQIQRFATLRKNEGVKPQTIKHNLQTLRNAYKWAKSHGYATRPLEFPKLQSSTHRLRYLTKEEEVKLLKALDPKADLPFRPPYEMRSKEEKRKRQDNYDLVVILLDTGARYGEIANIEWNRINLEERVINLWRPKVKNESIIYMTSRVHEILTRRATDSVSGFVFTNSKGEARGHATKGIRTAISKAGLDDFTVHDLRHTAASRLIQNGMSLYEVSKILGHTDVQTTQRYAHLEVSDVSQKARDIMESLAGS